MDALLLMSVMRMTGDGKTVLTSTKTRTVGYRNTGSNTTATQTALALAVVI
jgi:hypothetical protein